MKNLYLALLSMFGVKNPTLKNNPPLNLAGYRERVDFGEHIGYHVSKKNPNTKLPTTKGIIHYSKKGAHIVPSNPIDTNIGLAEINIIELRLSGVYALFGIITPNVRKVSIEEKNNTITLYFYYEKHPTENEVELSEEAATEVIADFPEPYMIDCVPEVIPAAKKIEETGYLLYMRYEA